VEPHCFGGPCQSLPTAAFALEAAVVRCRSSGRYGRINIFVLCQTSDHGPTVVPPRSFNRLQNFLACIRRKGITAIGRMYAEAIQPSAKIGLHVDPYFVTC
jgi:hypothetical protein